MTSITKLPFPFIEDRVLYDYLKALKDAFIDDEWIPATVNVTGVDSVKGGYQKLGRIIHVVALFKSNGSLAMPTNSTIKLPLKPFYRGEYNFAAHEFKLSKKGASTIVNCWMNNTTGLVSPSSAITSTADDYVFSGWYYTE